MPGMGSGMRPALPGREPGAGRRSGSVRSRIPGRGPRIPAAAGLSRKTGSGGRQGVRMGACGRHGAGGSRGGRGQDGEEWMGAYPEGPGESAPCGPAGRRRGVRRRKGRAAAAGVGRPESAAAGPDGAARPGACAPGSWKPASGTESGNRPCCRRKSRIHTRIRAGPAEGLGKGGKAGENGYIVKILQFVH